MHRVLPFSTIRLYISCVITDKNLLELRLDISVVDVVDNYER
jgi:hypothetical protein